MWQQAPRLRLDLMSRPRQHPQRRKAFGEPDRIPIEFKRGLDGGEPDLVDAKRALHRIAIDRLDQIALADNETGLRAAEQFVAGKSHNVRGGHGLPNCRLRLQPIKREVDQRARSEIVGERNARLLGEGAKVGRPNLGGETLNAVVRRVDL